MTTIEDRIRALEDIEAVRLLMHRYHRAVDGWDSSGTHKDPEAIAALFTEDGVWEVSARQPPPTGHAEIAAFARELQTIPWIVHHVVNPIVEIDGDTAHGEFKGIIRVRLHAAARLVWSMGRYLVDAARTPEGWKLRHLAWEPFTNEQYDPAAQ